MVIESSGKRAILRFLFMLALLLIACAPATTNMSAAAPTFHNPIAPIADPFVLYYQNTYYLTGTSTGASIQLWHDPHLEKVAAGSATTIWSPAADQPQYQVWSPSMFQLDYQGSKYWFVYFTAAAENINESHRIYVLQSSGTDPLGPYTFKGQLAGTDNTTAIDASLLRIRGKLYLMYVLEKGSNAVYIAPMSDPLHVSAAPHLLINPDQPWEQGAGAGQSTYPVAEGPQALYHNGKTFIVYSASDTGNYNYCSGMMTYNGTGDPLAQSSWAKSGPYFQYSRENGVYGPGRATFTVSPDGRQSWIVYHAKTTDDFTYEGRETRTQQYTWNADGTPNFGVPVSLETALTPPSGS